MKRVLSTGAVVLAATVILSPPAVAQPDDYVLSDGLNITDVEFSSYIVNIDIPQGESFKKVTEDGDQSVVSLSSDVLFQFGRWEVTPTAKGQVAGSVSSAPRNASVFVNGYTDSKGDAAYNLKLSKNRAATVAALIRARRPDLKIAVKGFGEAHPVAPNGGEGKNDNPQGRAKNRRVEIRYRR